MTGVEFIRSNITRSVMRTLIALFSAALIIWLVPAQQKTPANLNNVVRTAKAVKVKNPVRTAAPRKEPEHPKQVQAKPKPSPQPEKTKAVTTSVVRPVAQGCDAYSRMIAQYDWNAKVMTAVMRAESSCDPYAVNTHNYDGVYDYGLLQLHGQRIYDPADNIAAAYRLWRVQGYGAWTAYNSGAYLRYE